MVKLKFTKKRRNVNSYIKLLAVILLTVGSLYLFSGNKNAPVAIEKKEEALIAKAYTKRQKMIVPTMIIYKYVFEKELYQTGTATAFAVGNGPRNTTYVITNAHVCLPSENAAFYVKTGKSNNTVQRGIQPFEYPAFPIDIDPDNDLCLLQINEKLPVVAIEKNTILKPFHKLYIVGAPYGNFPIIIETHFSGYASLYGKDYLFLSAEIQKGHSGSPIFNRSGHLVGVVSMGSTRHENEKFMLFTYGGIGITKEPVIALLEKNNIKYETY